MKKSPKGRAELAIQACLEVREPNELNLLEEGFDLHA
jgi:hypothetical protein